MRFGTRAERPPTGLAQVRTFVASIRLLDTPHFVDAAAADRS
jgi:hypothetical protein